MTKKKYKRYSPEFKRHVLKRAILNPSITANDLAEKKTDFRVMQDYLGHRNPKHTMMGFLAKTAYRLNPPRVRII